MAVIAPTAAPAPGPLVAPPGLKGLVVADTSIGDVRGEEGFYHYRQYDAVELAMHRSFEEVWALVVDGALPDSDAAAAFARATAARRALPAAVLEALAAVAAPGVAPLDGLRTGLSLLAAHLQLQPLLDLDPAERRRDGLALAAATPTVMAALHRLGRGQEPIPPDPALGHAANLLWMLHGRRPDPVHARALERYLISTIDHGFNASTFTARVIASTGADLGACVVGALGALSGPLHGGAPSRALDLLDEIGEPERAADVVRAKLAAGERIMGFGHAVYRTDDPRSVMLRGVARQLGGPLVTLAEATEEVVVRVLDEARPGRRLRANVEWYAGVVMEACGVPRDLFTATFACSRVVGWCAHALEQAADGRILRPSARYVGPAPSRGSGTR